MKRSAFTLIEMLVVIGIIGILAGVLMGTFSGGTESARVARCLSNMRNLAAACQSAAAALGYYPPAGSFETASVSTGSGTVTKRYYECKGWISWNSQGAYRNATSHKGSSAWNISTYSTDDEARLYCLTNGVLWKYLNGSNNCFLCPLHERKKKLLNPCWTYVMNAAFSWDSTKGKGFRCMQDNLSAAVTVYGSLRNADKRLLFAEIPFVEHDGITVPEDTSGEKCDSILQYNGCTGCGSPESIGFNHKVGKQYYGHVAFADGHVEKLVYPKKGMTENQIQELTEWLCKGSDVSFDGKQYDKID